MNIFIVLPILSSIGGSKWTNPYYFQFQNTNFLSGQARRRFPLLIYCRLSPCINKPWQLGWQMAYCSKNHFLGEKNCYPISSFSLKNIGFPTCRFFLLFLIIFFCFSITLKREHSDHFATSCKIRIVFGVWPAPIFALNWQSWNRTSL